MLGDEAYLQGDYDRAVTIFIETAQTHHQLGDRNYQGYPLRRLGYIALKRGDLDGAVAYISESLYMNLAVNEYQGLIGCLAGLAAIWTARGQPLRTVTLLGCIDCLLKTKNTTLQPVDRLDHDRTMSVASAQLPAAAFDAAFAAGRALTLDQAIALALQPVAPSPAQTEVQTPALSANASDLTARERDVLHLLADGLSNQQIAERLVVSASTVRAHLHAIYGKLGVTTRSAATPLRARASPRLVHLDYPLPENSPIQIARSNDVNASRACYSAVRIKD